MQATLKRDGQLIASRVHVCLSVPGEMRDHRERNPRGGVLVLPLETVPRPAVVSPGEYQIGLGDEALPVNVLKVLETDGYISGLFEITGESRADPTANPLSAPEIAPPSSPAHPDR
jgi:hypothetical protein